MIHNPPVPETPLRIGILGAARIAPMAVVRPARDVPGATIAAVAARDGARARRFAAKHGIESAYGSYDELIADRSLDAVYVPLPNGLHRQWAIRALDAGKHVLCEKPLAANAVEAREMAAAATRNDRVLFEAFHYRYHPLARRMREIVCSGELGRIRHVEATFCVPIPIPGDIRYRYDLAGGATMDTGCYAISLVRLLAGAEPTVVAADALLSSPQVDRRMEAELRFADGRSGRILCSMFSRTLLKAQAIVRGDDAEMRVTNPVAPHLFHRLRVKGRDGHRVERLDGDATYTHQLRAFVAAVRAGEPFETGPADAVANMEVIDAVYRSAGLRVRGAA
jgi:predicted dehydrogenase